MPALVHHKGTMWGFSWHGKEAFWPSSSLGIHRMWNLLSFKGLCPQHLHSHSPGWQHIYWKMHTAKSTPTGILPIIYWEKPVLRAVPFHWSPASPVLPSKILKNSTALCCPWGHGNMQGGKRRQKEWCCSCCFRYSQCLPRCLGYLYSILC